MTSGSGTDYQTTTRKALAINLDASRYGTFAEIGAGQEVARHFFQAGHASSTVAKTISAYDKIFSDEIYGRGSRFVSRERLLRMLDHEYQLLEQRLGQARGERTCFFSFANTVMTSSHEEESGCHAWIGVRFQMRPGGSSNDILLHVKMLDRLRLQQQEVVGIVGVNLLYSAFYTREFGAEFIASLIENIGADRLEIDYIELSGPDLEGVDDRLLSLELIKQGITLAIMFGPSGQPEPVADVIYGKPLLLQRGTFRPITKVNLEILERGREQFIHQQEPRSQAPVLLFELSMHQLATDGQINNQDFLDRVDTVCSLGHPILVTSYPLFSQLKRYLRRYTHEGITIVIGATTLDWLFDETTYRQLPGGILAAMGDLFDTKTQVFVYPFKSGTACVTTQSFFPASHLLHLYRYLIENRRIIDISNCEAVHTSVLSEEVRTLLAQGDSRWEELVPPVVRDRIKAGRLFGYRG